jgi:hypothetical protein
VISFAIGELGISSLKRVYDMSFAEFQIRIFAYKRVQEREWEKVRILAWYAMTGSHQDPKKMPKSLSQFMSLDLDKKTSIISDAQKQRFIEAMAEYVKNKN